jgi:hypothetical protein
MFISFLFQKKYNPIRHPAHSNNEGRTNNFKGGKIMAAGG